MQAELGGAAAGDVHHGRRDVGRDQPAALSGDRDRLVPGVAGAGRELEHGGAGRRGERAQHPLADRGHSRLDARPPSLPARGDRLGDLVDGAAVLRGALALLGEALLEVGDRLPRRPPDGTGNDEPVERPAQPAARLELDHDPVLEPGALRDEVTLVPRRGQAVLDARVLDQPVREDPPQGQLELRRAAEQPQRQPRCVPGLRPARPRRELDHVRPVLRPALRVGDVVVAAVEREGEVPAEHDGHALNLRRAAARRIARIDQVRRGQF